MGRRSTKNEKRKHRERGGSVASSAGVLVIDCAPHIRDKSRKVVRSLMNPIVPMPILLIEPIEG